MHDDAATDKQHEDDASLEFEEHVPGRISKLEPHRIAITKMRERRWPYRKIAAWLATERQIKVNPDTVRAFCLVRDITKGSGRGARPTPRRTAATPVPLGKPPTTQPCDDEKEEFDFDDSKPLQTWKSRTGIPPER
jgi:hypothetical protein